ncbi:MAG: gamma-glutamyltransferase [Emcibacteraceae bacterium]|nr:gamma-glutamyltransferase [Emcibacteraceae bacterium]
MAKNAMAATSHPLSTETALEILKAGGNAMDAAVAACAVQCVVEPQSTSIGGDCFAMYAAGGGIDYIAYNGSGRAAAAANLKWFSDNGITEIAQTSPHAVTIPGAVDAWDRLITDHGRMSLKALLVPAIKYAKDGCKILPRVATDFNNNSDYLTAGTPSAELFMPNGKMLVKGDILRQTALANTLEIIGEEGRDGFYFGNVVQDMVGCLQELGGLQTLDDFKNVKGDYVTPIKAHYKGYDVYQCPPNGQGIIALMLLKVMERFDVAKDGVFDSARVHREIEAGRIAYHQRDSYIGDPDHGYVPATEMLSEDNITRMYEMISDRRINDLPDFELPNHRDTVYISVVDKDRNCASFINTIFGTFGSGIMAPKTGVLLHNRGRGFSLQAGHINAIAGNKRPLHTIIPAMVARDGRTIMPFGVMGGQYQAFGHMQFLSRMIEYDYDIQQAMDLPRFFPVPGTDDVEVEAGIDDALLDDMRQRGHNPVVSGNLIGGSQAIWIDWQKGTLIGGSDPRKDGCAAGY